MIRWYLIHYLYKARIISLGLALCLVEYYYPRAERTPLGDGSREPQGKGLGAHLTPLASYNPLNIPRMVGTTTLFLITWPLMAY